MITKEIAILIHNCYSEIEQAIKMITELKKSLNDNGELEIKDRWGDSKGLELHIPLKDEGYSIKKVPFQLAFDVIKLHVEAQEKELERLKDVCKIQLA